MLSHRLPRSPPLPCPSHTFAGLHRVDLVLFSCQGIAFFLRITIIARANDWIDGYSTPPSTEVDWLVDLQFDFQLFGLMLFIVTWI